MDFKSKVTYSGNLQLFQTFEQSLINAVPAEQCELRRSYDKLVKNITLEASFQPLDKEVLERFSKNQWSILEDPVFHLFVTECSEVETYKTVIKDEIEAWLKMLQRSGCVDWMILVVETIDIKKTKNLLTRTSVLDKIRTDFCSKNNCEDRCISILNPAKFEQKSTDSFRCLVQRLRFLLLNSYNKNLIKYDDLVRCYREKRNQDSWDFLKYFKMQENNALVLEKLQLLSDALAQYDEIESQFSQFVTNSSFGERSIWLKNFRGPISSFHGIFLNRKDKFEMREKIFKGEVTILDFRNYIFERQAHILLKMENQAEVAEKILPFLFSTLREVDFIKLDAPEGALACWQFVCALEVLAFCDETTAEPNEVCFQKCAPIWSLAKDKLYELGKLCGLLPGFTPSSEQLHIVVHLLAGIGETQETVEIRRSHSPHRKPRKSSVAQLKEALGSNQAFTKLYLELSELAISTYKHVSRLRSARLVGLDLGNFYCALNEPHKAVVFFTDLLRELKAENWNCLASQTLLELANCYRKMDDKVAYTKTCSAIACCLDLEMLVRTFYFDEFSKSIKELDDEEDSSKLCILEDYFKILEVVVLNKEPIIQDDTLIAELRLASNFPKEILVDKIAFSFEAYSESDEVKAPLRTAIHMNPMNAKLKVFLQLDYKQDNTLSCASVACDTGKSNQSVRRTSSTRRKQSPTTRLDFTNAIVASEVRVHPGVNTVELKSKATRVGKWKLRQLSVLLKPLEFLSENNTNLNCFPSFSKPFEITTQPASASLLFNELIAGIEQPVQLHISGGSFIFPADAKIGLKCSKNLKVKLDEDTSSFENQLNVFLSNFKSFEERRINLKVLTELPGRNISKSIDQKIYLSCPWSRQEIAIGLDFLPAITSSCRLHTCGTQKFLQVFLKGVSDSHLFLKDARMKCDVGGVELVDSNPKSQNTQEIYRDVTISYLWELKVNDGAKADIIKVMFMINYSDFNKENDIMNYACAFDVMDYKTLFKIQAQLEPTELCRVRTVCSLSLRITKVEENPFLDLMYEVLTDQNIWAVCGTPSGVISMKDVNTHSISLDVMPLSTGILPMPSVRLSKYIPPSSKGNKQDLHLKLQPFPPGQVYNSTKSMQVHVIATNFVE